MYSFGRDSQKQLDTCTFNIQKVMSVAIKLIDFSVICGFRNEANQNKAFAKGKSTKKWPEGKHNVMPSRAVDIAPYPIDWSNRPKAIARFYLLAGIIIAIAWVLRVELRWGGDWDGDWDLFDQKFDDLGHFEEVES